MFRDISRITRNARVRRAAGAALVVALAAEAWVEIWLSNPVANGWGGPRVLSSVLAVLAAVPLLCGCGTRSRRCWRRWRW